MTQPRRIEEWLVREVGLIVLLLVLALVQLTLLPRLLGISPLLLLALVLCRALVAGASEGLRWAFYGGIALDICAGTMLGNHALALLLAVIVVLLSIRRIGSDHWLVPVVGVFVGALVYEGCLAGIYAWLGVQVEWPGYAQVVLLPSALIAMVPALPIYMILRQLARWQSDGLLIGR